MIDQLTLQNFKAFEEIEIALGSITLLSGLNGSGKSSVIQSLGLLRQSFDANFLLAGDILLNGELVEIGTGKDVLYHDFKTAEISIELSSGGQSHPTLMRWNAKVESDADVLSSESIFQDAQLGGISLFAQGFQFLRADRITPSVTLPKSQHAVRQQRFLGPRGEYTAHFLLEFGEEITVPKLVRAPHAPDAVSLGAQVNAWMQEFSPGVRVEAAKVPMTDLVRLVYSYKGEGVSYGEPLRPTNVGFGLTHALPIIVACLAAREGTLLVVENPEAQLHPRGQAGLGRLLALCAAGGVQVIVESHSDHVLNGIRLAIKDRLLDPEKAKLHFFSRKPGLSSESESPTISVDGRLSYWPPGFFDQWEQSLDKLLGE